MAGADFRELTGSAANRVLVAIHAGSGVKYRPQAGAGIMVLLKASLVEGIGIAGRFGDAVADGLRSIVLRQRGGVKASGCFARALLRNAGNDNRKHSYGQNCNGNTSTEHALPPGQI